MTIRGLCAGQYEEIEDAETGIVHKYLDVCGHGDELKFDPKDCKVTSGVRDFKEFNSGAQKEVIGKLRIDLVPAEMIEGDAEVLTYGATKYADHNWEKGIPFMTSYSAAMRHLMQWLKGVDIDTESGLKHIEQARLNLGMIVTQLRRGRDDLDDRPSKKVDDESN
jgi:hypothetical protein